MKDSTILWLIIGGFVLFYISQSETFAKGIPAGSGTPAGGGPTGIQTPPILVTSTN